MVTTAVFGGVLSSSLPSHAGLPTLGAEPAAAAAIGASGSELGSQPFWSLSGTSLGAGWSAAVNTFTGNLLVQGPVAGVSGRGPSLAEGLVYNSQATTNTGLGAGWQLASAQQLTVNSSGSVSIRDGDGTVNTFTANADGTFTSPPGLHLVLANAGSGTYTLTSTDQTVSKFTGGWLVSVTDAKGSALTYTCTSTGAPSTLTDASGRKLSYSYDSTGRLTGVSDPAGRTTTLGYDASNRLAVVTDPAGAATKIGYGSTGRLSTVTDANGGVTTVFYDSTGAVVKVNDPRTTATVESATTYSYNASTLVTTVTDPAGKASTVTHNSSGNPVQVTDAAGITTSTTWVNNEATKDSDAKGSTATTYDTNGNVTATTDTISSTQSATTSATYDAKNNPISVTDPANRRLDLRYDPRSNLTSASSAVRKEADANTYDANGNLTSSTDPGAGTTSLITNGSFENTDATTKLPAYWAFGGASGGASIDSATSRYGAASLKLTAPAGTTGPSSEYAYSDFAAVTAGQQLTLSAQGLMSNVGGNGADIGLEFYDANGAFVTSAYTNSYTGSGQVPLVVTATVPAGATQVTAVVENDTATGTVWFDGVQLETPLAAAEGPVLSGFDYVPNSSFESGGTSWAAGGPSGAVTIDTTDAWGGAYSAQVALATSGTAYLVSDALPVRASEPLTLSGVLKTTSVAGTGVRVQVQYYDATGANVNTWATSWVTGTTGWTRYAAATSSPATAVSARVFALLSNSSGTVRVDNLKLVPRATTFYSYDTGGNYPTSTTDPLGDTSTYSYDADGNLTSATDPAGATISTSYDPDNRPVTITDPTGGITRFTYDAVGSGVLVRDPRSTSATDNTYATRFGYDPVRKRTALTDPLGRATAYAYDKAGNLTTVTNPSASTITYGYDGAGKATSKKISDGDSFTYTYDTTGDFTGVTNAAGRSYQYTYDNAHQLTGQTTPSGYSQTLTRDPSGAITSATDSDAKTTKYAYSSDGKLLTLTDSAGRATTYRYNETGQVFQTLRGDGTATVASYDSDSRPDTIADPANPGGWTLYYGYDSRGNLTTLSSGAGQQQYTYDSLNRLTNWTNETGAATSYGYDAAGNLISKGPRSGPWTPRGRSPILGSPTTPTAT